jgi:hypothetical protein
MLHYIEKKLLRKYTDKTAQPAPVFVMGLPRSGTTLFYQLLLNYFDWAYFTRWTNYSYRSPVTAYRMQHSIFPKPRDFAYRSDYGKFQDPGYLVKPWRPVEGHNIWRRWFPEEPTHCYRETLSVAAKAEMLATIAAFTAISGSPFLSKNPRNSVRLLALADVFPNALFVVVKRHSLYVAQSLYVARLRRQSVRRAYNNSWWGTKPSEFVSLKHLDPLRQSVGQTIAIERELQTQLLKCKNPYIEIEYKDICERPGMVLHLIQESCQKNNIRIREIRDITPTSFPIEDKRKVSEEEFNMIQGILDQKEKL